jgi:Domain of unknown function (DUF4397)
LSRTIVRPSIWLVALVALAMSAVLITFNVGQAQSATGRVRVIHASADTPPVDIFVDGQKAISGLAYSKDTGYVALPTGSRDVKVFVSPSNGTGTPALQAALTVASGKDYTVLAVGEVTKSTLALLPLEDNNATPATGQAHVRLIHASPDAPAVDVVVAGTSTKVFSAVAYKGVGTYTPVPAGTYNLDVKVAPNGQTITGLVLRDRGVYTAVAMGPAATLLVVPLLDAQPAAPSTPAAGTGLSDDAGGFSRMAILGAGLLAVAVAGFAGTAAMRARSRAS